MDDKNVGRKFFLVENFFVAKSVPRNSLDEKKFGRQIFKRKYVLVEIFFVANSFPRKQFG